MTVPRLAVAALVVLVGLACAQDDDARLYKYAASCMPLNSNGRHFCNFIITPFNTSSTDPITVNVTSLATGTQTIVMTPKEPFTFTAGEDQYPTFGFSTKVYYFESYTELQVVMNFQDQQKYFDDSYQALEMSEAGKDYFALSQAGSSSCSQSANMILVLAFEDDTEVTVGRPASNGEVKNLNKFGVWMTRNFAGRVDFISGTFVSATRNVMVVSGNMCLRYNGDGTSSGGAAFTVMRPLVTYAGNPNAEPSFVAPNIGGINQRGYLVKVVASEDNTIVSVGDGADQTLNRGDILNVELLDRNTTTPVFCSEPCNVVTVTLGQSFQTGLFMLNVVPVESFYKEAYFSTTAYTSQQYITIVAQEFEEGGLGEIILDGQSLLNGPWKSSGGFSYVDLTVASGYHEISSETARFAVYVYSHSDQFVGGYGYAVSPIKETVIRNYEVPAFAIRHNGTAVTTSGSAHSPLCASKYVTALETKVAAMALSVNEALGTTLCPGFNRGEFYVNTATTVSQFIAEKMFMEIDSQIVFRPRFTQLEIVDCAEEIGLYMNNHANWERPILPDQADCSPMAFTPEAFAVDSYKWKCSPTALSEDSYATTSNILAYDINVVGVFDTQDGTVLSTDCTRQYGDNAATKTNSMKTVINDAIPTLCGEGVARVAASSQSFSSFGNQALLSSTFILEPQTSDQPFTTFLDCMYEVYAFAQLFQNWGEPVLATPPGCPVLVNEKSKFQDGEMRWACVNV